MHWGKMRGCDGTWTGKYRRVLDGLLYVAFHSESFMKFNFNIIYGSLNLNIYFFYFRI